MCAFTLFNENLERKLEFGPLCQYARKFPMHGVTTIGLTALLSLLLLSCSGKKQAPNATEGADRILAFDEGSGQLALEKKFANYTKDVVLDEEGNILKDSKRSNFEGKQLTTIGGDIGNKRFAANRYSKKNWQGSKDFDSAKFKSSKNRWDNEEWFIQKQARESGAAALSQGQAHATNSFGKKSAREQGGRRLGRPSDVETDVRRRVSQKPLIVDQEAYEKMSLEESKNILGR